MVALSYNTDSGLLENVTLPCGCFIEVEFNLARLHYQLWVIQHGNQTLGGDRHRVGLTVQPGRPDERLERLPQAVAILETADAALHALED